MQESWISLFINGLIQEIIADVLFDKYKDLLEIGWKLEENEIRRDIEKLFSQNFWDFVKRSYKPITFLQIPFKRAAYKMIQNEDNTGRIGIEQV